ncbi:hypothetical protein EJ04DRAFT_179854 [Polyplosphaeria fusca]|uniref:Uncharacterized protein n=1 Tax=Polyplosphaeria fusca TaxID=682080 RepID=A0A9P4V3Y3_9PLEO|nr:hypothetical protein EJ04DRAFT_179854 [Polyplosphaeria fusca]
MASDEMSFLCKSVGADSAPPALASFPFLRLPRELRDAIYDLALEPTSQFLLADTRGFNMRDFTPNMDALTKDNVCDFGYESLQAYDEEHGDHDNYLTYSVPLLFFRMATPTGLITACRQTSYEVKQALDTVYQVVRSSINRNRVIENPDPRFLDVCSRSIFAFRTNMLSGSHAFLSELSPLVRQQIRSIVIGMGFYLSENMSNKGMLEAAMQFLPNLSQVGLLVDSYRRQHVNASGHRSRLTLQRSIHDEAVSYLHLKNGRYDVLRLLYQNFQSKDVQTRCPCVASVTFASMNDQMDSMADFPPMDDFMDLRDVEMELSQFISRHSLGPWVAAPNTIRHEFEEWPEMSADERKWTWLGARTAVKLTRADQQNDIEHIRTDFESKFGYWTGLPQRASNVSIIH